MRDGFGIGCDGSSGAVFGFGEGQLLGFVTRRVRFLGSEGCVGAWGVKVEGWGIVLGLDGLILV